MLGILVTRVGMYAQCQYMRSSIAWCQLRIRTRPALAIKKRRTLMSICLFCTYALIYISWVPTPRSFQSRSNTLAGICRVCISALIRIMVFTRGSNTNDHANQKSSIGSSWYVREMFILSSCAK